MSELTNNVKPLDDFNWDEFENGTSANVSKEELDKAYDETLNKVSEHQVTEGTVISVDKKEVIVNIGYKSDGIIPASEFRYNPDLKVGDKVEVYVENQEDVKGQLVLSHKKARQLRSWDMVNEAFDKGEIVAVNGEKFDDKIAAIQKIEEIGASYAIGRDCNVGDTIIGIKGRVAFEAAAPKLIIEAHRLLEKSTLSKWQQYWKDQVGNWYGMFLHESQYLEPVMPDIEAMLTSSQRNVNGTAILKLRPYSFQTVGIDSPDDLTKSKLGEYGEMQHGWTAEDAKGFIKVSSTPLRVYYGMHPNEER